MLSIRNDPQVPGGCWCFPSSSATRHKVFLCVVVFLSACSAAALSFSWTASCPLAWRRMLRIGGGIGIGVGSVGIGLLRYSPPQKISYFKIDYKKCHLGDRSFFEEVEEEIQEQGEWRGYLVVYFAATAPRTPTTLLWVSERGEIPLASCELPVRVLIQENTYYLAFADTSNHPIQIPADPPYNTIFNDPDVVKKIVSDLLKP